MKKELVLKIVSDFAKYGEMCMDQSKDDPQAYNYWDGFTDGVNNVYRELKEL